MRDETLPGMIDALLRGEKDTDCWDYLSRRNEQIELALVYGNAFWPDLLEIDNFVLLASNYDEEYFDRILHDVGQAKLEATINTTYLRNLFGDADADESVWEALGNVLAQTWKARASTLFPDRTFDSRFAWYSDIGDPAVTLFQAR